MTLYNSIGVVSLFCLIIADGCFYLGKNQAEDILQKPSSQWSSRDCLTVILSSMQNNLYDQGSPNIKLIATPYTPAVIAAINRMSQTREHWSDDETQRQIDTSLVLQAGLFLDPQTSQFMDSHGNYMGRTGRLDALQFLLTLRNNAWPCAIPVVNSVPLTKLLSDWPCYIPDISHLDQQIYLSNDKGFSIKPKYVWGRRNNQFTLEETLVVAFDLEIGDRHLFDDSGIIILVLDGFEVPIKLKFRISDLLRLPVLPIKTSGRSN